MRKAEVIKASEYHDAVYLDGAHGDWEDGYSSNIDALIEAYEDAGEPLPTYCYPCNPQYLRIDAETIIEQATDDMHEDARDQVIDERALFTFCDEWNKKQTCASWYPDSSRVIVLDDDEFAALIAEQP